MIARNSFALLLALALSHSAYSFELHPCLSLLGSYTLTLSETNVQSGTFGVQNRMINFGFEFTNKFYLHGDYFISTGLRYNQFKTDVSGKAQASGPTDQTNLFFWETGYISVTIPLEVGKEFTAANGNKGDFYIGLSAGILMNSSVMTSMGNISNDYLIGTTSTNDISNIHPVYFYSTADFGASYQPFRSAPRFSMGILCTVQLSKPATTTYGSVVKDQTTGNAYNYSMQNQQRFTNCALTLNYKFVWRKRTPHSHVEMSPGS